MSLLACDASQWIRSKDRAIEAAGACRGAIIDPGKPRCANERRLEEQLERAQPLL